MSDVRKMFIAVCVLTIAYHLAVAFFPIPIISLAILADTVVYLFIPTLLALYLFHKHNGVYNEIFSEIKLNNHEAWVLIPAFILGFYFAYFFMQYQPMFQSYLSDLLSSVGMQSPISNIAVSQAEGGASQIQNFPLFGATSNDLQLFYIALTSAIAWELTYKAILIRAMFRNKPRYWSFVLVSAGLGSMILLPSGLAGALIYFLSDFVLSSYYYLRRKLLPLMTFTFVVNLIYYSK